MGLLNPGSGYTFARTSAGTNLNIEKEWQGYVAPSSDLDHPFKVYLAGNIEGIWYFSCTPGLINNIDPTIQQQDGSIKLMTDLPQPISPFSFNVTTGNCYIVLNTSNSSGNPWPYSGASYGSSPHYPIVGGVSSLPSDTSDEAWLVLAMAHKDGSDNITINQYVTGSLWGDRIKVGTDTAQYFYARI